MQNVLLLTITFLALLYLAAHVLHAIIEDEKLNTILEQEITETVQDNRR